MQRQSGKQRNKEELIEETKETRWQRRLREKEEAEKLASQIENQLTINLDDEEDKKQLKNMIIVKMN